jgi:formate C-acetyltransferase
MDEMEARLGRLRERVLEGDNRACFVERETVLRELRPRAQEVRRERRYGWILEKLLDRVSTPIVEDDMILGRVVEERSEFCPTGGDFVRDMLPTRGHLTLDWAELLNSGLEAIAERAEQNAHSIGTDKARDFAANARACCDAVVRFAHRYAKAARERAATREGSPRERLMRAARALEQVPAGPARSFFEALQSVWLIQMVTSCYIGARDFGARAAPACRARRRWI